MRFVQYGWDCKRIEKQGLHVSFTALPGLLVVFAPRSDTRSSRLGALSPSTCTIVFYHHPYFNIGPEGPASQMSAIWKLMAKYHVDIVLNGHNHDYQRWRPLDANGNVSSQGITEFVLDSSGHGLQTFTKSDSRVIYSNDKNPTAFGTLLLTLHSSSASFRYENTSGAVLDSGAVPCGSSTTSNSTCAAAVAVTPNAARLIRRAVQPGIVAAGGSNSTLILALAVGAGTLVVLVIFFAVRRRTGSIGR